MAKALPLGVLAMSCTAQPADTATMEVKHSPILVPASGTRLMPTEFETMSLAFPLPEGFEPAALLVPTRHHLESSRLHVHSLFPTMLPYPAPIARPQSLRPHCDDWLDLLAVFLVARPMGLEKRNEVEHLGVPTLPPPA